MTEYDIKRDPLYLDISEDWYKRSQCIEEENIFCKFFFLWCSFNALYNLVGEYETKDNIRIQMLIGKLSEEDSARILGKTQINCDFFMRRPKPITDMKKSLFGQNQPDDVTNFEDLRQKYLNPNVPNLKKIRWIGDILYRVRNNLTHGSKESKGTDKEIILNAVPILEHLVTVIALNVFNLELK